MDALRHLGKRADSGEYEHRVAEFPQPTEPDCATIESVTPWSATGCASVASLRMLTPSNWTPARTTQGEFLLTAGSRGVPVPDGRLGPISNVLPARNPPSTSGGA